MRFGERFQAALSQSAESFARDRRLSADNIRGLLRGIGRRRPNENTVEIIRRDTGVDFDEVVDELVREGHPPTESDIRDSLRETGGSIAQTYKRVVQIELDKRLWSRERLSQESGIHLRTLDQLMSPDSRRRPHHDTSEKIDRTLATDFDAIVRIANELNGPEREQGAPEVLGPFNGSVNPAWRQYALDIRAVMENQGLSNRNQLAQATGLSYSTASMIFNALGENTPRQSVRDAISRAFRVNFNERAFWRDRDQRAWDIGQTLRQHRLDAGLSGKGMGDILGVGQKAVSNIETGRYLQNNPTIQRYCDALNLPAQDVDAIYRIKYRALDPHADNPSGEGPPHPFFDTSGALEKIS